MRAVGGACHRARPSLARFRSAQQPIRPTPSGARRRRPGAARSSACNAAGTSSRTARPADRAEAGSELGPRIHRPCSASSKSCGISPCGSCSVVRCPLLSARHRPRLSRLSVLVRRQMVAKVGFVCPVSIYESIEIDTPLRAESFFRVSPSAVRRARSLPPSSVTLAAPASAVFSIAIPAGLLRMHISGYRNSGWHQRVCAS